ncbi:MAG: zinc ribbon domain-containing protein [Muribaculaceae bacterium]|nr:zinc ribbon domain-containing protein [Muribaculaceae bacterium]
MSRFRCYGCGASFREDFRYCPRCGREMPPQERRRSGMSVWVIIVPFVLLILGAVAVTAWLVTSHDRDEAVRTEAERLADSLARAESLAMRQRQYERDSIRQVEEAAARAAELRTQFVRAADFTDMDADRLMIALRERGYVTVQRGGVDPEKPAVMGVNVAMSASGVPEGVSEPYSAVVIWPESGNVEVLFDNRDDRERFFEALIDGHYATEPGVAEVAYSENAPSMRAYRIGTMSVRIISNGE